MRRFRFALRPGWLALHVLCLALIVTMVLLGRWQLIVSDEKHFSLQNFGYALQWWAFSCFVAFMWVRLMRDRLRRDGSRAEESPAAAPAEAPVAYRRYVMPSAQSQGAVPTDPALTAYNDYLAKLAARDASR